jgi:hypothetical protein
MVKLNKPRLKQFCLAELDFAAAAVTNNKLETAWAHLERAHIASQPFVYLHLVVHIRMAGLAIHSRDYRESFLQLPRLILAGPSSLLRLAPAGNPGSSRYGLFEKRKIPEDMKELF